MKSAKQVLFFLIFSIIIAVPPLLLSCTGNPVWLVPHFWLIFFFMSFITLLILVFISVVQRKRGTRYAQAFLGATTFKLLCCLIFLLVYIRKIHPEKVVFIVDFMYIYFLNTMFEIYSLLRNLRNQNSG